MSGFSGLSIILPTVNETVSLKETVAEILRCCDISDIRELILATADFATPECRAACDDIQKNYGSEVPVYIYVQTGSFEEAICDLTELVAGSHFIYQPTDLEEDPSLIAEVIRLAKLAPDAVVSGSRAISGKGFSVFSPAKRVLYRSWGALFSLLYGRQVTDPTLFYRCMSSDRAKRIVLKARSYSVLFELFLKMLRIGSPVVEFPVEMGKRDEGRSNTRFVSEGLRYTRVLIKTRFTPVDRFLKAPAEAGEAAENE